jgi:hypothetical protein
MKFRLVSALSVILAVGIVAISLPMQAAAKPKVAPPAENALKSISDVVHRVRQDALQVINDIEQRSMVVTGEAELIRPIAWADKDPVPWAQQMLELGPALPPHKKWLDTDVDNLGEAIQLLQEDIEALQFPDTQKDQATPAMSEMNTLMQDVQTQYKNLQGLSKGPKYDNIAIGKAALAIYDDMKKMEKPWKQALQLSRTK